MAVSLISTYTQEVDNQRLGYQAISVSSLTDTAALVIKAGSKLEIGGALYSWGADETPAAPGGGFVNNTVYYIYVNAANVPAPSAYSATAPTWDTSKQGFYQPATTIRCIARLTWQTGSVFIRKYLYPTLGSGQSKIEVPIGAVISWHKSFTGTPALPDGWLECNGQTVADTESPFNGQVIPDYNSTGRFIRGGTTSGTLQAAGTKAPAGMYFVVPGAGSEVSPGGGSRGTSAGDAETRPINVSMVWIIRIK